MKLVIAAESCLLNTICLQESAAKHLYNEVPESTFTRTVSNPEAVMKKRREQKLQKRGGLFNSLLQSVYLVLWLSK